MRISTHWLKDFVEWTPPLERVAERLTMAGLEVKKIEAAGLLKDQVFEIEITTNRPDWLSHLGVAREIAAVENLSLKIPAVDKGAGRPMPGGWKIHLKDIKVFRIENLQIRRYHLPINEVIPKQIIS